MNKLGLNAAENLIINAVKEMMKSANGGMERSNKI